MLYVKEQASPVSFSNDELGVSLRGFGLPHPDPTFQGDETIPEEDDVISITWAGLLASATQANLSRREYFKITLGRFLVGSSSMRWILVKVRRNTNKRPTQ